MNPYLSVAVGDSFTLIHYVTDGEVIISHSHPIGFKHIEAEGMNVIARSKLLDGIMYVLEFISLHDRIPTNFKLTTSRYATWIGETLEDASYTQFFTDGVPVNVTLEGAENASIPYARHSQTLQSFKI